MTIAHEQAIRNLRTAETTAISNYNKLLKKPNITTSEKAGIQHQIQQVMSRTAAQVSIHQTQINNILKAQEHKKYLQAKQQAEQYEAQKKAMDEKLTALTTQVKTLNDTT